MGYREKRAPCCARLPTDDSRNGIPRVSSEEGEPGYRTRSSLPERNRNQPAPPSVTGGVLQETRRNEVFCSL